MHAITHLLKKRKVPLFKKIKQCRQFTKRSLFDIMLHPVVINYLKSKIYQRAKKKKSILQIPMINCKCLFFLTILGKLQEDDNKHNLCEKEFLAIVKFQQNIHSFCSSIKTKEQNTSQCTHEKIERVSLYQEKLR